MASCAKVSGFSVKEVINAVERITVKSIKVVETERRPGDPPSSSAAQIKRGRF